MNFRLTRFACYLGYITQAVVNNFLPLLFITLENTFGIGAENISLLIAANFITQLIVDLISPPIIKRIGARAAMLCGCASSAFGIATLSATPFLLPPLAGLSICVFFSAVGGGIMEVLVSPIVEGCPSDNKAGQMSLLHSFYCWGSAGCVLLSTLFFMVFGRDSWRILAVIWAVIPLADLALFVRSPINPPTGGDGGVSAHSLLGSKIFYILLAMMICSGASELAVSQWASAFAESALGVSKSVGDIAGPFAFAVLMGSARLFCGKLTIKKLPRMMAACSLLCAAGYAMIALAPVPAVSLAGCGVCGLAVGVMWPGTFSIAADALPKGGTLMFALLALAGDLGCVSGPMTVGLSRSLKLGFTYALLFPVLMLAMLALLYASDKDRRKN